MKKTKLLAYSLLLPVFFMFQSIHVFGEKIVTESGKTYDAIVIKPKPDGLILFLKSGKNIKVDFKDLSGKIQKRFNYDPKKAKKYKKKMAKLRKKKIKEYNKKKKAAALRKAQKEKEEKERQEKLAKAEAEAKREFKIVNGLPGRDKYIRPRYIFFKDNSASIPFASDSGKLLFQFKDGKVVPDRNFDGVVDSSDGEGLSENDVFKVPVKIGGEKVDYPIKLTRYDKRSGRWASFQCDMYLANTSGENGIQLYDLNLNGSFGEIGKDVIKTDSTFLPLNSIIIVDGSLQKFEIIENGKAIKLLPYEGAAANLTVKLANPNDKLQELVMFCPEEEYTAVINNTDKSLLLPGVYKIMVSRINISGDNNSTGSLVCYSRKGQSGVTIKTGENSLSIGSPLKLDFSASKVGNDKIKFTNAALVGSAGERYRAQMRSRKERSSLTAYILNNGSETELCKLEYG